MEKLSRIIGRVIGTIARWFISTAFIMWGWNILAPYINCPIFGYWEVFAMRMGFSYLMGIIGWSFTKKESEEEKDD